MFSLCVRRRHIIGLLALLTAPVACQDALNPQFLAAAGVAPPISDPGGNVVLLIVNERTDWDMDFTFTVTFVGGVDTWTVGLGSNEFTQFTFECGFTQIEITGGTVFRWDLQLVQVGFDIFGNPAFAWMLLPNPQPINFPGPPLTGQAAQCGAVLEIFVYAVGVQGAVIPTYEASVVSVTDTD